MTRDAYTGMCVWCGSTKAYFDKQRNTVCCPVCGGKAALSTSKVPTMAAATLKALVEARYGNAATAALRRQPQTRLERIFRDTWDKDSYKDVLPVLLSNRYNFPNGEMTLRDAAVARQLVQWLGSPNGVHFLYECGFKHIEEIEK